MENNIHGVRWFSNGKLLVVDTGKNVRNAGFHGTEEECRDHVEMLREIAMNCNLRFKYSEELK